MTYCVEYPSGKKLLIPTEPLEPNNACFVCSKVKVLFFLEYLTQTAVEVLSVTFSLG